jgi:hypothetical protein
LWFSDWVSPIKSTFSGTALANVGKANKMYNFMVKSALNHQKRIAA